MRFLPHILIFFLFVAKIGNAQTFIGTVEEEDTVFQNECKVVIRDIYITGNKKTKDGILLRELPVEKGQAYSMPFILRALERANENLMNTTLFVTAKTDFRNWFNDSLDITIHVSERWYYFPLPVLSPVDRNWNVWVTQHKVSLDRINYGIRFRGQNITGSNDRLNLFVIDGYTKQYALKYENPFISKDLRHGASIEMLYGKNREINYTTRSNQQIFFKDDERFARNRWQIGIGYSYRKGSLIRHNVKLNYNHESIADTIATLNPKFFGAGRTKIGFPELQYRYQYLGVDYIPYPLRGFRTEFNFLKRGIGGVAGMNLWMFNVKAAKFILLSKNLYFSFQADATLKLPFTQPFYNQQLLGYNENYLRGLEYYVIDGVAGGMLKATIRKKLGDFKLKTGSRSKTYSAIPVRIYLKAYGDIGYAYNKQNYTGNILTNKLLYTGGVGLDVVTIYDMILRFEFSFNQIRERSLFIHMNDF